MAEGGDVRVGPAYKTYPRFVCMQICANLATASAVFNHRESSAAQKYVGEKAEDTPDAADDSGYM